MAIGSITAAIARKWDAFHLANPVTTCVSGSLYNGNVITT